MSGDLDEIDALASGLNMLGEELKAVAISRDYFDDIFNSVSDMMFILNDRGVITDVNRSVSRLLGYCLEDLLGKPVSDVEPAGRSACSFTWLKALEQKKEAAWMDTLFRTASGRNVPVNISAGLLSGNTPDAKFLIRAHDNTRRHENENRVLRAMIDAQESERYRISRDIHDSLGQKLSAIQFQLSSLANDSRNKRLKGKLAPPIEDLRQTVAEMRLICFHLLPPSLKELGLLDAVKSLSSQPPYRGKIDFAIDQTISFPELPAEIGIDLFRVIQEFVTNAIDHGKASRISIRYGYEDGEVHFMLKDNGVGFDADQRHPNGRGLQNVRSRVESHQGEIRISSFPGRGTGYEIIIPVN